VKMELEKNGPICIAHLNRRVIGNANSHQTAEELAQLIHEDSAVILDLSGLNAMDASGLGLFLKWIRDAQKSGMHLCVYGLSNPVRVLFEMLSLHMVVAVCESREEALLYFRTVDTGGRGASAHTSAMAASA
jgi:anti-anti-sigma factor